MSVPLGTVVNTKISKLLSTDNGIWCLQKTCKFSRKNENAVIERKFMAWRHAEKRIWTAWREGGLLTTNFLQDLVKTNINNVRRFLKTDVVQRSLRRSVINWKYWLSFLFFRIVWHLPFFISCSYSTDSEWMTSFKTQLVYFALQIIVLGSRMLAKRKGKMKAKLSVLIVSQVRVWVDDKPRGFQPKIKISDSQRPNLTVRIFVFDAECCKWSQSLPGVRSQTTNLRAE